MARPTRYILEKPTSSLVRLQRKINSIFVRKRDNGEQVDQIYKHLIYVEKELSRRRVFWF
jgi:hypothetical protein